MGTKTTSVTSARERARAARARLDAERNRRDEQIEAAAARYFDAADKRAALTAELDELERELAGSVHALVQLKEPAGRIAELLDIEPRDVTRLTKLAVTTPAEDQDGAADENNEAA